ncbi:MAG: hypothetical protein KF916_00925 [Microbacteriaceae bacterium]|nr:hypothetical protein [Microbacteriaceae bacterium]
MPRRGRRVRTKPAPGSDPTPGKSAVLGNKETEALDAGEAELNKQSDRLEELKRQKPPHYS